jgi:hypothetical protein
MCADKQMTPEEARRARARARATWPGTSTTLQEMDEGAYVPGTAEQRLALVTYLSDVAWALSGRPLPSPDRSTWPGRVLWQDEP